MLEKPNSLYNADLAPVPPAERIWGIYNYASLWIAMSVCIPTYMLASGLIAGGMTWKQALFTILLGNVIVLIDADPDDNKYCDCAIAGKAAYIVSEDKHFNALKAISFPKLTAITLDEFLQEL